MSRLPVPGSDDGTWGSILNDYLAQVHNTDGTLKANTVGSSQIAAGSVNASHLAAGTITNTQIANGTITEAKLDAATQAKIDAAGGAADWNTLQNKPAVIAAGADQASARAAIGAGTSSLTLAGNGSASTASRSDHTHTTSEITDITATGQAVATAATAAAARTAIGAGTASTKADVGLGNVDNTSDATKNSAAVTLTNKTISGASNTLSNIGIAAISATGTASSTTFLRGDGTWSTPTGGDASTNTSVSVDGEVTLFSGTGGKTLKRATGSGVAKITSGVLGTAAASDIPTVAAGGTGPLSATDASVTDSRTPTGSAGGDLTGTYPNPTLPTTVNSTPGSFGSATQVATVTTNNKGQVTASGQTSIQIAESQVTNLTSDLGSKVPLYSPTAVKTGAYTAAPGEFVPTDATSGAVTITLPAAPADKTRIGVKKIDSSANAVMIARAGSDVFEKSGGSTTLTLSSQNQSVDLQYASASGIWYVLSNYDTGAGDVSSNTGVSVDSELAVFNGTSGKSIKRATGSGVAKLTSGVLGTAAASDIPTVAAGGTGPLSATDPTTTNSRTPSGSAGGDLTGTYPNPTLSTTVNSTPGSFGSATQVATITTNNKGQVTASGQTSIQIAESQVTNLTSDLAGKGDASTNTATSVDGEVALFSGTTGKTLKRATGSGVAKLTAGVLGTATSGTDYAPATATTSALKGDGSGGFAAASLTDVGAPTADYDLSSHKLTSLTDPTNAQDAATKNYVDSVAQGLKIKQSAHLGTTAAETYTISSGTVTQISGTTIDGVTPAVNDRVLVKDAPAASGSGSPLSSQAGNGIYVVTANSPNITLSRAADMSGSIDPAGSFVFVTAGTVNASSGYVASVPSAPGTFTYGTDNIAWSQFSGAGQITANNGLSKSGNNITIENSGVLTVQHGGTGAATLTGLVKGNGTGAMTAVAAPAGAVVGDTDTQTLTNKNLTSGTNTFPTFNQNTTGSAAKLTTARTIQTDLTSTSSASFDGTANITPGVTGTLPVGSGGTGAITLTGLVKGNGTSAMTAASGVTDYVAPYNAKAVQTGAYSAQPSDFVPVDTTSGTVTITLPTAPTSQTRISVKKIAGSNAVTVAAGGSDVFEKAGGSASISLTGVNQSVELQYATGIWYVLSNYDTNGSVSTVSVTSANGFSGSVSNPTTTPAISIGTTVTGVLVGNGTSVSGVTAPAGAIVGTTDTQTLTHKDLTDVTNTFPTFNQNTTGSAAKWTTARNLAGNSVDGSANVPFANKFIVQGTSDAGLSGAQFLGALGTGLVKNTTSTGVLSVASGVTDYIAPYNVTAIKTGAYTANPSEFVPVDATSGSVTITLPTTPTNQTRIAVKKIDSSANTVVISRGGSDVFEKSGGSTSITFTAQNQSIELQYNTGIWYVLSNYDTNGAVSTVSVTSANGFSGSVSNATTTPAISITTSVTGLLKGNGTSVSAASTATDYVAPTRAVNTTNSLTGGGDLSADRTLSLVNDSATPGNSKYYGTNGSGTKGYYSLPTVLAKYTTTIGDTVTTVFNLSHGLGSDDVVCSVRDSSTGEEVECDKKYTGGTTATLTFATAPGTNAYKVVVIG